MCALSHGRLCDPTYCSPPGSSVHGIFLVRILQWVTIPSSTRQSNLNPLDWGRQNQNHLRVSGKKKIRQEAPRFHPQGGWQKKPRAPLKDLSRKMGRGDRGGGGSGRGWPCILTAPGWAQGLYMQSCEVSDTGSGFPSFRQGPHFQQADYFHSFQAAGSCSPTGTQGLCPERGLRFCEGSDCPGHS